MSLWLRIKNRNNMIVRDKFPEYNPISRKWLSFWTEQKRRVYEGMWVVDSQDVTVDILDDKSVANAIKNKKSKGNWRYMTSNLYFYVNISTILHRPKGMPKTSPKIVIRPFLRDFEYEVFYHWAVCRGFSGFQGDEEFSGNVMLTEDLTDDALMNESLDMKGNIVPEIYDNFFKKDGTRKKYKPSSEIIRELYDHPMGLALFNNEALNLMMLGSRGGGKSFIAGVGIALHEVITNGEKYYTKKSITHPPKAEVFVGSAMSSKSKDMLSKTKSAMENLEGVWKKGSDDERPSALYKTMKGQLLQSGKTWENVYDKKINGEWKEVGTFSYIKHGTFTVENPEAAAGGRYSVIVIEEVGLLPNVLTVSGSNEATQMSDGTVKYGSSLYLGTAGNIDKIIESEILFTDPEGFNFLALNDDFENTGKIGFFIPATHVDGTFKDENGNTMEEEALAHYKARRLKKAKASSSAALELEKYNYPLVPSEMFASPSTNSFPVGDLKERLSYLSSHKDLLEASNKGLYVIDESGKPTFKNSLDRVLLTQFPITKSDAKKMDLTGAVEMFEPPIKDDDGIVPYGRYIGGMDPIDDDGNTIHGEMLSLQSFFLLDTWTNRIVLEYTGRTRLAKDYYEQVRRALLDYNALLLYENNKKGLFGYFDTKSSLRLLADTPTMLRDTELQKGSISGNKSKGIYATPKIKEMGLDLLLTWLVQQAANKDDGVQNLHTIRSKALLLELIKYNPKLNTDRVSALIILMIYKMSEEKIIVTRQEKIKTLADDPLWNLLYN